MIVFIWDLKVNFIFFLFQDFSFFHKIILWTITFVNPIFSSSCFLINCLSQNFSIYTAIKFLLAIGFLILIRGGTPRYRYDYLTKLGWLKFLSMTLYIFIVSFIFIFIN